jgi:hypothetical protein
MFAREHNLSFALDTPTMGSSAYNQNRAVASFCCQASAVDRADSWCTIQLHCQQHFATLIEARTMTGEPTMNMIPPKAQQVDADELDDKLELTTSYQGTTEELI